MLKRNGEIPGSIVPGSTVRLTTGQFNAYTAAFATIQPEFDEMRQMQRQLKRFPEMTSNRPTDSDDGAVTIVADGIEWQAQAQLLKLPKSAIFLCRERTGNECAIIQRFLPESAYAEANGQEEILSRGVDPRHLVANTPLWFNTLCVSWPATLWPKRNGSRLSNSPNTVWAKWCGPSLSDACWRWANH
jgi:hypothetical protein